MNVLLNSWCAVCTCLTSIMLDIAVVRQTGFQVQVLCITVLVRLALVAIIRVAGY
jgi:hypothetical protein